jgi:hypothetical protein
MAILSGFVKHRIFVSYHHGGDQAYYDAFSNAFHYNYESIYDNSLDRTIDSENSDYVIQRIRDNYITGTSCTLVLVGNKTWGRKYVDWEIKATLDRNHGLIGVRLPSAPLTNEGKVTVPDRLHHNIVSGYALWVSWSDITASTAALDGYISAAKNRPAGLIDNTAERRLKNA